MSLLTVRGVTRRYGDVTAVANVDLDVPAGSRTAIVGPSGSGKTTLLRMIAGFEVPDEGTIALGGEMLADGGVAMPAHRRGIGYVAQEGALFPHLTIGQNIAFGLDRTADRKTRIAELMDLVGLESTMAKRRPHELSGGQQQRVALARALARRPRLMLLDEPFSALDAALRESTREMVGEVLSAAGVTTILVTHDQAEALSFADHLAIMRDGRVVQAGPPQHLYLAPYDEAAARFLGEAIILEAEVAGGLARSPMGWVAVAEMNRKGPARIMLRPEQIAMRVTEEGAQTDAAKGRVVGCFPRGPTTRVVIEPMWLRHQTTITLTTSSVLCPPIGAIVQLDLLGTAHVFAA